MFICIRFPEHLHIRIIKYLNNNFKQSAAKRYSELVDLRNKKFLISFKGIIIFFGFYDYYHESTS